MRKGTKSLFLCSIFMAGFLASCNNNSGGTTPPAPTGYDVWGAPAMEKILEDKDPSVYEEIKEDVVLTIDSAKHDYENDQIIISAKGAVQEYDIEVSDLQQVGGDGVFAKENVKVYNLGYCNVYAPRVTTAPAGWYPDLMVPFENIAELGENNIEAGKNQGLMFVFYTPEDQATGEYKGTFTLTVDGEETDVEVNLRVRNTQVSKVIHSRTRFGNTWPWFTGEYDSSQDMFDKYLDIMAEYYVGGALARGYSNTREGAKWFAEKAWEYGSKDGFAMIFIPLSTVNQFSMFVEEVFYQSVNHNFNILEKCYSIGPDEPTVHNNLAGVMQFQANFDQAIGNTVETLTKGRTNYLSEHPEVDPEFYDQMIEAVKGIRWPCTTAYSESYAPYIDVWCPMYNLFETGNALGYYDDETEVWFYGALSPSAPYTSYHISNTQMGNRMLGWFQGIYNVTGNLYWASTNYAGGGQMFLDDYYTNPYHTARFDGEGFLFYPGQRFNVDGPLPSIRMESIRDGLEEYELIYALKNRYKAVGEQIGREFTADEVITNLAAACYSGMKILGTEEDFNEARSKLLSLCEFSESGICFVSYNDDGEGNVEFEVFIPDGATLSVEGITAKNEVTVEGGKIVTYTMNEGAKKAAFKTTVEGVDVSFERDLPGAVEKVTADSFESKLAGTLNLENTVLVDGSTIDMSADDKFIRLSLTATDGSTRQSVEISAAELLAKLGSKTQSAKFNFYYDGFDELEVNVYVKFKGKPYATVISTAGTTFQPGMNSYTWENVSSYTNEIEYIRFVFGNYGAAAREDLYFKDMIIQYVREED